METSLLVSNPFALMLDPSAVVQAMEQSDRLSRLKSRICRPLDKVAGGGYAEDAIDVPQALDDAGNDGSTIEQ